ncbi:peptidoglycan-binding protein [Rhodopila sp.]|jgi:peptidoglycan hydrolase-like protein with peptidoglycan-binding domain|uniref:peptidoglycan-binding protein n=1 Tax=Rhodopila sp. TaxID=2480087 RepID=UPI002CDB94CC|nr:peptidoglycan-binding protein [Rhodopila sp.]HVZ10257.1 peptidoglycan-binding protein [Rhodopila sp.]
MVLLRGDLAFRLPMQRGEDVRQTQLALARAGVFTGVADGVFGPITRTAVVAFQTQLHIRNPKIVVDGIVGRDTWSALFPDDAPVETSAGLKVPPSVMRPTGMLPWRVSLGTYLPRLTASHGSPLGRGPKQWQLTPQGICLDGNPSPPRTQGAPTTAANVWTRFRTALEKCAAAYGVPVELLIATACTESGGDPSRSRQEPGFVSDDSTPDKVSPGLMQTLISTARHATGDPTLTRDRLFDPETSIRAGAAFIAQQATRASIPTGFDPPLVAIAYNAGSLREAQNPPPANSWGLVQTDRGGGVMHTDAFVAYFNDSFAVLAGDPPNPRTPSLWALQQP